MIEIDEKDRCCVSKLNPGQCFRAWYHNKISYFICGYIADSDNTQYCLNLVTGEIIKWNRDETVIPIDVEKHGMY